MEKLEVAVSRVRVLREGRGGAVHASIGVPTYNGAQRLSWLLQSMRSNTREEQINVTILDDGSPRPGEMALLQQLAEQYDTRLIAHGTNLGITASWNDLVRSVPSDICILLNDDVILTPFWFDNLVYFLENNECGAASPALLFCTQDDIPQLLCGESVVPRHPHTKAQQPDLANQDPNEPPGVVMCALGSGFGFRRSVFNMLGGFDERMTQIYNESDFGTAAAAAGLPSYCIPSPRIWHLWSATFLENPELGRKAANDQKNYIAKWGGDFDVTHPKFMHNTMPSRLVKWIGSSGCKHEAEIAVR